LCVSSSFTSFRIFAALELLMRGHSVRAAPGLLDFARPRQRVVHVLEDSTGAEPAKRSNRCLLSRALGSHIPQQPLHVGNSQEGTAVVVEWLVLVLLEAAPEM
jgi:hypothetical protein